MPLDRRGSATCALAGLLLLAAALPNAASAYTFGPTVQQLAVEETVQRCDDPPTPSPDLPARAYRDSSGNVHLTLARMDENRQLVGPGVSQVTCQSSNVTLDHDGGDNSDVSTHEWREWIASPYKLPGGNSVAALIHNEFHAYSFNRPPSSPRPDLCSYTYLEPQAAANDCWDSAITLSVSPDGGDSYPHPVSPPDHFVAGLPFQYRKDWGFNGYHSPTNIIKKRDADGVDRYYTIFNGAQFPKNGFDQVLAQHGIPSGHCVMRTDDLLDPTSWRAWDGSGYNVQFVSPYPVEPADPGAHACAPIRQIGAGPIGVVPRSLTFNTYFNKYMLVGNLNGDVYYLLSDDLVSWSPAKLVMDAPTMAEYRGAPYNCTGPDKPIVYPTLIDAADSTENFERTSQTTYLYFTQRNPTKDYPNPGDCTVVYPGYANPLMRIRIKFGSQRTASGGDVRCPSGFDETSQSSGSFFALHGNENYSGAAGAYRSSVDDPIGEFAYGTFTKDGDPQACEPPGDTSRPAFGFTSSDEVWYRMAFKLPPLEFWSQVEQETTPFPSVSLLRLESPESGDWAGMLTVDKNARLRFSTSGVNPVTKKQILGPSGFQIMKDECWHQIEVHQKFSPNPAAAVNEVWIDGVRRDVSLADDANVYSGKPYNRFKAGAVAKANLFQDVWLFTDDMAFGYSGPTPYLGCNGTP
jgi:hypothetical protein